MMRLIKLFLPLTLLFVAAPYNSHAGPWSYSSLDIPSFEGQVNTSPDIDLDTYKVVLELQAYKSTFFDNRGYNEIKDTAETIIVDIKPDGSFEVPEIKRSSWKPMAHWSVSSYLVKVSPDFDGDPLFVDTHGAAAKGVYSAGKHSAGDPDPEFVNNQLIPELSQIYLREIPAIDLPYETEVTYKGDAIDLSGAGPVERPHFSYWVANGVNLWVTRNDGSTQKTNLKQNREETLSNSLRTKATTFALFGEDGSGIKSFSVVGTLKANVGFHASIKILLANQDEIYPDRYDSTFKPNPNDFLIWTGKDPSQLNSEGPEEITEDSRVTIHPLDGIFFEIPLELFFDAAKSKLDNYKLEYFLPQPVTPDVYSVHVIGEFVNMEGEKATVDVEDLRVEVGKSVLFGRKEEPKNRLDMRPEVMAWKISIKDEVDGGEKVRILTLSPPNQMAPVGRAYSGRGSPYIGFVCGHTLEALARKIAP